MEKSFSFPPPPPPPPKAKANDQDQNQQSHSHRGSPWRGSHRGARGGRGTHRGEEHHGRGPWGRGGHHRQQHHVQSNTLSGNSQNAQHEMGYKGPAFGSVEPTSASDSHAGYAQDVHEQQRTYLQAVYNHMANQYMQFQTSYGSQPGLQGGILTSNQPQSQPCDATQHQRPWNANNKSKAASAPHAAPQAAHPTHNNQGRTNRGFKSSGEGRPLKRKRDETNGRDSKLKPVQPPTQHRQVKPKVATAPAVPDFGFSLPSQKSSSTVNDPGFAIKSKGKRHRGLGLVQGQYEGDDSDDSVDEEAEYVGICVEMRIEYKGEVYSLRTPSEVAAWRKERKKEYPTKKRTQEKIRERLMRQIAAKKLRERVELERMKNKTGNVGDALSGSHDRQPHSNFSRQKEVPSKMDEKDSRSPNKARDHSPLPVVASKDHPLPQSLHEGLSKDDQGVEDPIAANMMGDLELNYSSSSYSDTDSETGDSSDDSSESSSEASSEVSSSSSSDSDEAPEEQSSKEVVAAPAHNPERDLPLESNKVFPAQPIRIFTKKRPETSRPTKSGQGEKRVSLYAKLKEQERKEEDAWALKAIKQLGKMGFFD